MQLSTDLYNIILTGENFNKSEYLCFRNNDSYEKD